MNWRQKQADLPLPYGFRWITDDPVVQDMSDDVPCRVEWFATNSRGDRLTYTVQLEPGWRLAKQPPPSRW